jgi:hypothetical protein
MQVSKGLETRDQNDETETSTYETETETKVFGLETETMSRDLTSLPGIIVECKASIALT